MITLIAGEVRAIAVDSVVLGVGGFGVRLLCPSALAGSLRVGQQAELAATLVVREDSLTMYGFADNDQRGIFELLQSVSGFGPKIALAVLSTLTSNELRAAVASGDERALTAIPGIGRKGAQRLMLELGDKLGPPTSPRDATSAALPGGAVDVRDGGAVGLVSAAAWRAPVREALIGLGWSAREAESAVAVVAAADVETSAGMSAEMSGSMSSEMSAGMSAETSAGMSAGMSAETGAEMSGSMSAETGAEMSGSMSADTGAGMSAGTGAGSGARTDASRPATTGIGTSGGGSNDIVAVKLRHALQALGRS